MNEYDFVSNQVSMRRDPLPGCNILGPHDQIWGTAVPAIDFYDEREVHISTHAAFTFGSLQYQGRGSRDRYASRDCSLLRALGHAAGEAKDYRCSESAYYTTHVHRNLAFEVSLAV